MPKKGYKPPKWLIEKRRQGIIKAKPKKGIYKNCVRCDNKFYCILSQINKRIYCSTNCSNKANAKRLSKKRMGKGNPMYGKKAWNSGKLGLVKGKRGKDNHFWRGGVSSINYSIRRCNRFKDWRNKVFERDNWICQKCNNRGGRLDPHHLIELSKLIKMFKINNLDDAHKCKEIWDISNGQTLCHKCHLKTKSYGKH